MLNCPSFIGTEYFHIKENGEWILDESAPEEMKDEFKEVLERLKTNK